MRASEEIFLEEISDCLLCGSSGVYLYRNIKDLLYGVPGEWNILVCSKCELAWLNPQPAFKNITKLYKNYHSYAPTFNQSGKAFLSRFKKTIERDILAIKYGFPTEKIPFKDKIKGMMFSMIPSIKERVGRKVLWINPDRKGQLLDVGCGSGQFLVTMRTLGWEVYGIDPDYDSVHIAQESQGLNVSYGMIEDISFPDNSFDIITLNHVIEHIKDPLLVLKKCNLLLKPEGRLILITPNIRSLGHKIFKQNWRGLEAPRHCYIFSPKSLLVSSEISGLQVTQMKTLAMAGRDFWYGSRVFLNKELKWRTRLEAAFFQCLEQALVRISKLGEEIFLTASKKQ